MKDSGDESIREDCVFVCPNCKNLNIFHPIDLLIACAICKKISWLSECEKLTVKYNKSISLEVEGFVDAISSNACDTKEKEIYLRTRIWWSLNDLIRNKPEKIDFDYYQKELFKDNLYKLVRLLDEANPSNRITIAEIYRELGDFKTAEYYLEGIPEEYKTIMDKLKDLCSKHDNKVTEVCIDATRL